MDFTEQYELDQQDRNDGIDDDLGLDSECECGGLIDEGGWCLDCDTYYEGADTDLVVVDGSEYE